MKLRVVRKNHFSPIIFSNEDLKQAPTSQKIMIADNDPFWGVDLVVGRIVKVSFLQFF